MSEPYETIRYSGPDEGGIARVTLHRPDRLNAFTTRMGRELVAAFDEVDADSDVRAAVVTGEGRAFCAGADLSKGEQSLARGLETRRDPGGVVALRIFGCTKPVVAAVNGAAAGFGATMTLPMDARFAAPGAKFGFVFTRLGIVPEACSSWFLPRLVGVPTALDWLLAGRTVSAGDAHAAGLVQRVVDDPLAAATEYARGLAERTAPVSVALTRQMVWRMLGAPSPADAHDVESALLSDRSRSADAAEGVAAFKERRAAKFPQRAPADLPAWPRPNEGG